MRVGIGYDSHRFDATRPLVLGGVEIPHAPGLAGHSDADAIAHAVIDALFGASGLGAHHDQDLAHDAPASAASRHTQHGHGPSPEAVA
jgi:2-C-methyl-D-erythritol 2,4-cyclodiphosphate synthase